LPPFGGGPLELPGPVVGADVPEPVVELQAATAVTINVLSDSPTIRGNRMTRPPPGPCGRGARGVARTGCCSRAC